MDNLTGYSHCPHCGGQALTSGFAHSADCPCVVGFQKSGWVCPRCSRVWGPDTEGCDWCNNGMIDISGTFSPIVIDLIGGSDA